LLRRVTGTAVAFSRFFVEGTLTALPFNTAPANLLKALQNEITFEKEAAVEQPATPEFLEEFNKQGLWKVHLERISAGSGTDT
jgi:hypothetical protein